MPTPTPSADSINRASLAYREGWDSSHNAHTGGNPYASRPGEADWLAGRREAFKHFGVKTWDEWLAEQRA